MVYLLSIVYLLLKVNLLSREPLSLFLSLFLSFFSLSLSREPSLMGEPPLEDEPSLESEPPLEGVLSLGGEPPLEGEPSLEDEPSLEGCDDSVYLSRVRVVMTLSRVRTSVPVGRCGNYADPQ